jgi:putative adenylate-forming enzyme
MSPPTDTALAVARFARARWGWRWRDRAALLAWQERQLREFLRDRLPRAPFYAAYARSARGVARLEDLPIVDKQTLVTYFDDLNTRGIRHADALAIALAAERSRDFRPEIGDITVGMSSGTSGQRGVFLVSRCERLVWAGIMLARVLSPASLARLIAPWRPPLAVAFFLRANSNLYTTLRSHRLVFTFHDLLQPLDIHVAALAAHPPDVLVAPATVLRRLADLRRSRALDIQPQQVISVAETLEPDEARVIADAFDLRGVQQIYQATEGFLGYTCDAGRVHLNEECVHIEPEWLDADHTRFHPIVTDFTRETQIIARYRLDDVLRLAEGPCPCGRVSLALAAIDGRRDAILRLPAAHAQTRGVADGVGSADRAGGADSAGGAGGERRIIFPDLVRRAMLLAGDRVRDYRIVSTDAGLIVRLSTLAADGRATSAATAADAAAEASVRSELMSLFAQQGVEPPAITFLPWQEDPPGDKCCRIRQLA